MREIQLKFYCQLKRCRYNVSEGQCITLDGEGQAWVCPELTAVMVKK